MAPRGPTAYFIFAGEHRANLMAEIAAANGGKASVALVGKAIGEKWKELTEEQKQGYKDQAAEKARELKEQYAAEQLAGGGDNEGEDAAEAGPSSGPTPPLPFGFPLSLVKKIACMDPDVDRMAGDAVKVLSKATALFVELLATKSYTLATTLKRKNFKYSDIEAVAKKDRRLGDMGLAEMFEKDAAFEEVRTKIAEEAQNKLAGGSSGRGRKKAVTTEEGGEGGGEKKKQRKEKPLTAFFGAKPAAGNENNEEEVQVAEDEEEEEEAAVPMAEELEEEQVGAEDEEEEEEEDAEAEEEADDPLEEDEDAIEEEDEEEEENDDDDAE